MLSLFCVWVFFPVPLCGLPGGKGTAVPSVCHSGEATAGETRVAGAQEAEAGRRAGEGGHSLTFVSFGTCFLYNEKTAQNFTFTEQLLVISFHLKFFFHLICCACHVIVFCIVYTHTHIHILIDNDRALCFCKTFVLPQINCEYLFI